MQNATPVSFTIVGIITAVPLYMASKEPKESEKRKHLILTAAILCILGAVYICSNTNNNFFGTSLGMQSIDGIPKPSTEPFWATKTTADNVQLPTAPQL